MIHPTPHARRLPLMTCRLLLLALLVSCTTDSYDKGEGKYSQMLTDFVEVATGSQKQAVTITTDDGVSLSLTRGVAASWMQKADSTYRAQAYYNKVGDQQADLLSLSQVPTVIPREADYFKRQPQDPVGLESAWLAASGKYINLGLLLKNGRDADGDEALHALALVCDEVRLNDDQTRTACYRLLHDQGDAPQYYTNRRYVSILLPAAADRPDSVRLTIQTYDGPVEKRFKIK